MTKDEMANLVDVLIGAYPADAARMGANAAEMMRKGYSAVLEEFEERVTMDAAKRCMRISKQIPSASMIRGEIVKQHVGNTRPGGDAWGDVVRAVSTYGFYRTPEFRDPMTARAVNAIGWRDICSSTNVAAERARFIQLYDSYARLVSAEQVKATIAPGAEIPALVGDVIEGEVIE